jgi:hypothetical protein
MLNGVNLPFNTPLSTLVEYRKKRQLAFNKLAESCEEQQEEMR